MNDHSLPNALSTLAYPLWIKISLVACLYFLFMCLRELPTYFEDNRKIKQAEAAFAKHDWHKARKKYAVLSKRFPTSKKIGVCAAKAYFQSDQIEVQISGLEYIADFSFKRDEWKDLERYMSNELKVAIDDLVIEERA